MGVREEGDASEAIEVVSVYLSAIDQTLWMNVTSLEYASMANSKSEDRWTPGPLSAQTGNAISSLSETNAAFVIESAIAVLAPFGIVIGFSTLPLIGAQPLLDHYARDVSEMIDRSMTDLYSGIDGSFVDVLMQRRINPFDGGWFN